MAKELQLNGPVALAMTLLVPALLWIACWPFVDSPVNDDFAYAFTTQRLLETGRLTYNGWSSPILGPQALWGALFAKLFGFSHDILRLSTLPAAIACSVLTYALHRRLGISRDLSLFATLFLVGSPLFTAWSASFMTDIPALLFTLIVFHCLLGGVRSTSVVGHLGWAIGTAAAGWLGGAVRQSVLVLACVTIFILIFRHRQRTASLTVLLLITLLYMVGSYELVQWQQRQPYALYERWPALDQIPAGALMLLGLFLQAGLYLLPLTPIWIAMSGLRGRTVALCAVACVAIVVGINVVFPDTLASRFVQGLWVGNTITPTGMLENNVDTPGQRAVVFNNASRLLIGAAVYWQIMLLVLIVVKQRRRLLNLCRNVRTETWSEGTWIVIGLLALAAAYIALLTPRAALRIVFDRYLLVLIPILTVLLLAKVRRRLATPVMITACVTAILFALFGVALTSDHFTQLRARERLVASLIQNGLARTEFSNGLAYDGWTQLQTSGYANNTLIMNPPDAFVHFPKLQEHHDLFWFLRYAPSIEPRRIILNAPFEPAGADGLRVTSYRTLLPPFRQWLVDAPVDSNLRTPRLVPGDPAGL